MKIRGGATGGGSQLPKPRRNQFDAHETARLHALDGVPLASFRARLAAFFVDLVPVTVLDVALTLLILRFRDPAALHGTVHVSPFHGGASLVLLVLYFGLLTYFGHGRTPGKRLLRIRVVSTAHERLTLWQCIERSLGYGASALEGGFGFVQYFFHPNRRTVHDRIAETIVVSERTTGRAAAAAVPQRPGT